MFRTKPTAKTASENLLWKWFSIFIRLRDATPFTGYVSCITCGAIRHWRDVDCGHFIGRQHKATKYNECNNNGQCKPCNGFEGGRLDRYRVAINKKWGEGTAERLEVARRAPHRLGAFEIKIMADEYRKRAQEIAREKSLEI